MRTDDELLAAAAAGDDDAVAAVFRRHERAVTRFAIHRCASPDEVADAIAAAIDAARRGPELAAALARLPARERVVLELVVDDDLSAGEVAAALAITPNAARMRLSRARRRLREALDDAPSPTELPEASHA